MFRKGNVVTAKQLNLMYWTGLVALALSLGTLVLDLVLYAKIRELEQEIDMYEKYENYHE